MQKISFFKKEVTMLIASCGNIIGHNMAIPWHLSADLKRFKKITWGGSLIMGSKTYNSLGKILPGRNSIVLTKNSTLLSQPSHENLTFVANINDAWRAAETFCVPIFIIGGSMIYRLFQNNVTTLLWTKVFAQNIEGDTFFDVPKMAAEMICVDASDIGSCKNGQPDINFSSMFAFI